MRPGPWLLVVGDAAGLLALVIFVGHPNFRHPGLTSVTRRLSNDAGDACEYCERLPRDWEKRVCGILSGGAGDGRGFADFFFSGIAANATRAPRYGTTTAARSASNVSCSSTPSTRTRTR